jgi:hypothetical protein
MPIFMGDRFGFANDNIAYYLGRDFMRTVLNIEEANNGIL